MAKTAFEVDKAKLIAAINKAEEAGPLANMGLLWQAAEKIYNLQVVPRPITAAVIGLRAKEWKLQLKTKPGKRGRSAMTPEQIAAMQAGRGQRVKRADKFKKFAKEFEARKQHMPESKHPLVDRAAAGSTLAAIHAHCYNCSGQKSSEAKLCLAWTCDLYHLRPGAMPYAETLIEANKQTAKELKEEQKVPVAA